MNRDDIFMNAIDNIRAKLQLLNVHIIATNNFCVIYENSDKEFKLIRSINNEVHTEILPKQPKVKIGGRDILGEQAIIATESFIIKYVHVELYEEYFRNFDVHNSYKEKSIIRNRRPKDLVIGLDGTNIANIDERSRLAHPFKLKSNEILNISSTFFRTDGQLLLITDANENKFLLNSNGDKYNIEVERNKAFSLGSILEGANSFVLVYRKEEGGYSIIITYKSSPIGYRPNSLKPNQPGFTDGTIVMKLRLDNHLHSLKESTVNIRKDSY